MKAFRKYIYQSSADFTRAMLWEAKYIFRDKAVFFSFVIVAVVVSFLYTYLYSEETLQKLPIGVVDEDNTAQSRQLLRMIDANSGVAIYSSYLNLSEAEKAFQREQIRGIVTIPNGFARDLQRGEQPSISVYADASYMLYYKQVLTAAKLAATYLNAGVEMKRSSAQGKLPTQAREEAMPVSAKVVSLYNPSSGYATFLIPVVLVIIFQTTILTAVGILGGTMREGNKLRKIYPNSRNFFGALPIVMGKATTYLALAMVILLIILGIVMPLFGIPVRSSILTTMVFMIPFIFDSLYGALSAQLSTPSRRCYYAHYVHLVAIGNAHRLFVALSSNATVAKCLFIYRAYYLRGKRVCLHYPNGCLTTYHYALLAGNVGIVLGLLGLSRVLYQKNHK